MSDEPDSAKVDSRPRVPEQSECTFTLDDLSIKTVSLAIILISIVLAVSSVPKLFEQGFLMNSDHPLKQGMIKCYIDGPSVPLPSSWCSFIQSGIASFQATSPLIPQLVVLLGKFLPLDISYKLVLLFAWFFLPVVLAGILWRMGHPIMAAIAFSLMLLSHGAQDVYGVESMILTGSDAGQSVSVALFFLILYL